MLKTLIVAGCLVAASVSAQEADCPMHEQHTAHQHMAEKSPYTDRTALPIKALNQETLDAYRNGTGNGLAIAAELNGYPGPRHILDLAEELKLDAGQQAKMKAIFDGMHDQAVKIGQDIIDREKKLDEAFAHGHATDADVRSLTAEIATLQGTLRYTHLAAHLQAKALLTPEQVAAYQHARGY